MSEMKNRVARRLWNAQHPLAEWDSDAGPSKLERVKALNLAQIAIEVMREPTLEMLTAGAEVANTYKAAGDTWSLMIDAALRS